MPRQKHFSDDFCPLESLQKYVQELDLLLENVILNNKSESIIICGPSGCGKSVLLNEALSPYLSDKKTAKTFQCIRIDGTTETDVGRCMDNILFQMSGTRQVRPNGSLVGSVGEKLKEFCDALTNLSERTEKRALIFIIDRLENFIEQRNQLLLYALFDAARNQKFPMCVIGVSTVPDVQEKMEKRVKSRFSQRIMTIPATLFATFQEFSKAVRFTLERRMEHLSKKELDIIMRQPILQRLYDYKKDWQTINRFVEIVAVCGNSEGINFDQVAQFFFIDSTQIIIRDLPYLHLALLLCCFEFTNTQQENTFNFNMIREVYHTAVRQKSRSLKFGDDFVGNAFIELEEYGLLRAAAKVKNEPRQYRSLNIGVSKFQLRGALKEMDLASLPTDLRQWCEGFM